MVGIDASAAAMGAASRRASAKPTRGGLPNARFFVDAAESLPGPLAGLADVVTVTLPWGSLLLGVLGREPAVMRGLTDLLRRDRGSRLEILLSVTPRDHVAGLDGLSTAALRHVGSAWEACGLRLVDARPAAPGELAATGSSWARRLGARPVWRLELER